MVGSNLRVRSIVDVVDGGQIQSFIQMLGYGSFRSAGHWVMGGKV